VAIKDKDTGVNELRRLGGPFCLFAFYIPKLDRHVFPVVSPARLCYRWLLLCFLPGV